MFPSGEYKLTYQLKDEIDKNIFRMTYYTFLNSSIKFDGK